MISKTGGWKRGTIKFTGEADLEKTGSTRINVFCILTNNVECPNCGELKLSHHICQSCGYYNKKAIISKMNPESDDDSDSDD